MRRGFAVLSSLVLALVACKTPVVAQDFRIDGDVVLLQALRDAQSTNLARVAAGRLRATVAEINDQRRTDVQALVIWQPGHTYWEYSLRHHRHGDALAYQDLRRVEMIENGPLFLTRLHDADYLQIVPDRSRGYERTLRLRPDQLWFSSSPLRGRSWTDLLEPDFNAANVKSLRIEQDGDNVVLDRVFRQGMTQRISASWSLGANIVSYSATPFPNPPEGVFGLSSEVRYEWSQDEHGVWYPTLIYYAEFESDPNAPSFSYTCRIDEFTSQPEIPADRFEQSSLELNDRTIVDEMGPNRRTYRYGKADDKLSQEELDRLAEQLRQRGFGLRESRE